MDYRLVVTDLDGTLFDSESVVPEANAKALRAIFDRGIPIAIASGRRYAPFALQAAQSIGRPVYLILCNGAVIVNSDLKEVIFRRGLTKRHIEWIVKIGCSGDEVHWCIRSDELDLLWRRSDGGPVIPGVTDDIWIPVMTVADVIKSCPLEMLRIRMWASVAEITALRQKITAQRFSVEEYPYPGNGDSYIECMAPGVSKAAAIKLLAKRLGFGLENVIAFGDGTNDVEMLAKVGLGVAMANATEAVRRVAKMHTGTNDENGVAQAIGRLFPVSK